MKIYTSDTTQNKFTTIYEHKREITSLEALLLAARYDHVPSKLLNNYRAKDNFAECDCIIMDLDNGHTDNPAYWKTEEDIKKTFPGVKFYYVYSRNHMKAKGDRSARPRMHIYFPLAKTIPDYKHALGAIKLIGSMFPYFDVGAEKPVQAMFGVDHPKGGEYDGNTTIDVFLHWNAQDNKELLTLVKASLTEYAAKMIDGTYFSEKDDRENIKTLFEFCEMPMPSELQIKREITEETAINYDTPQSDSQGAWISDTERDRSAAWFETWAREHNQAIKTKYQINTREHPRAICYGVTCPWEHEHTDNTGNKESVVIIDAGGKLNYLCRHGHCASRSWKEYREKIAPGEKAQQKADQGKAAQAPAEDTQQIKLESGIDAINQFMQEVITKKYEPIPTGIQDLDWALQGGFVRKNLVMLGAAPGMGKTTLAQWIFETMAIKGYDVLYINLEMSKEQLIARSLSKLVYKDNRNIDMTAMDVLRGYKWKDEQESAIEKAVAYYRENIAPHLCYNPNESAGTQSNNIDDILKVMQAHTDALRAQGRPAPLVCVDYLQIINTNHKDTIEGLKNAIISLKDFAKNNATVVMLIMANNRESNKSGTANLESGRDTSAIEYSGDVIMQMAYTAIEDRLKKADTTEYKLEDIRRLKREAYERKKPLPHICNYISVKVVKNRFGDSERRANLFFDGKHSTFQQMSYKAPQSFDDATFEEAPIILFNS